MADLAFSITSARAVEHSLAPAIALELAITGGPIHSAMLGCQVAIEPAARAYEDGERSRLGGVFGAGAPPRALVWAHASVIVPGFVESTCVELVLACPLDVSGAAAYLAGVQDGVVPIIVQLSGSIFYDRDGRLQVKPVPRDREARWAMPLSVWRAALERHYADQTPVALGRDVLDRLHAYRSAHGLATLDHAIERLLAQGGRA